MQIDEEIDLLMRDFGQALVLSRDGKKLHKAFAQKRGVELVDVALPAVEGEKVVGAGDERGPRELARIGVRRR